MRLRLSLPLLALTTAILLAAPSVEGAEPARVVLQAATTPDGRTRLTATVTDGRGAPVAGTPVTFKMRTTFGWLTLLETSTAKDGIARTALGPGAAAEIAVQAGEDGEIRAALLVGEEKAAPPRTRPGYDVLRGLSPQPGFISPYPVPLQVALFGGILAGVWTTYGWVVWLLLRIRRAR